MNVTATPNTRLLRTPLPRSYHQSTPFCIWPQKAPPSTPIMTDRKSTRLNSSHQIISYAVFCLKKKNLEQTRLILTDSTLYLHESVGRRPHERRARHYASL